MRRFTNEELAQLKEAEQHFFTCTKAQYKRATTLRMDTMVADIWDAATGEKIKRNFNCGQCSYNMYLKVGRKYYEDLVPVGDELEPKSVTNTLSVDNTNTQNNKATNKKQKDGKTDKKTRGSAKSNSSKTP